MSRFNTYPDWLLQRAGFSNSDIQMYHKIRDGFHHYWAEDMADAFLILLSIEQDKATEDEEFLPGT